MVKGTFPHRSHLAVQEGEELSQSSLGFVDMYCVRRVSLGMLDWLPCSSPLLGDDIGRVDLLGFPPVWVYSHQHSYSCRRLVEQATELGQHVPHIWLCSLKFPCMVGGCHHCQ